MQLRRKNYIVIRDLYDNIYITVFYIHYARFIKLSDL